MRVQRNWVLVLAFLVIVALVANSGQLLFAQEARGTVVGRVMDASGGVVPGAAVEVVHKAMGTKTAVMTNDEGFYQASYLIPGVYQITVELPGFKKTMLDDVQVRVNDRLELNVKLEVGEPEQIITVTGEAALLNTAAATMGQVVDSRRVADLPLAHGNPYALIGMAAGASFNYTAATLNRPFEPTHIVGYAINGSRANRMDVMIDGVPSTATANANEVIAAYVPPTDIVQEFKVQTANFDASSGNTEGGVTNISLKSGTNQLSGTAYWANQPVSLAANGWLNNRNGQPKTATQYNRWGGSLGGPLWVPKLYDGRNRTFFFWGYEAIHETRARNNCGNNCTIPTAANRNGDFSQQLTAGGTGYQIYNPFTRRLLPNGTYESDPFPNNIIPSNLINPIAKKILDFYPTQSITAGNALGQNNHNNAALPEVITYYTHSFKVDHNLTESQRLAFTGRFYKRDSNYNNYLDSIATGEWFQFLSRAGGIDYVNTLTPTTVLNLRYGYNRFIRSSDGNPGSYGMDITTLGFPQYLNDYSSDDMRRFPSITFPGGSGGAGYIGTAHGNFVRPIDTHVGAATFSKMISSHSLRIGAEARAYRENSRFMNNDMTGRFDFTTEWTRGPLNTSAGAPNGTAQAMAAFLLGLPSAGNSFIARTASYAEQSTNWGLFFQDDWKVNDRLTLNLGLRWEYEGPMTERYNRSVKGFDFNAAQPFAAQAIANYTTVYNAQQGGANPLPVAPSDFKVNGGYTFATADDRGLYNTPTRNFLPQIGFAYKITEKTIMRGGFGINYGFLGQRRGDVVQDGFSQNTGLVPTLDNGLTWQETLSNPFQGGVREPQGSADGIATFVGQNVTFFNQDPDVVYNQRWQLGFQQQMPMGWVWDIAYVGNRGTNIEISRNLNATPNQYLSTLNVRDTAKNTYMTGRVDNPLYGLIPVTTSIGGSKTITREGLLRPYPQFGNVTTTTNQGYSWYHSLQTGAQRRFAQGYTLQLNYTWSKFMQATEYLNPADPLPTEVISDMDTPHRFSVTGIWELPFGPGQRFTGPDNGFVSRVIGGWQVNASYAVQSARPMGNWGNLIFNGDFKDILLPEDQRDNDAGWLNPAGFNRVSAQQLVYNIRTFPLRFSYIRPDMMNNVDFSVLKNTQIAEDVKFQFRAEFLNLLNTPNYPQPDINPVNASFGKITGGQLNYPRFIQLGLKLLF